MSGSRTAVITGGGGFVIANVARLWLEGQALFKAGADIAESGERRAIGGRGFRGRAARTADCVPDTGQIGLAIRRARGGSIQLQLAVRSPGNAFFRMSGPLSQRRRG